MGWIADAWAGNAPSGNVGLWAARLFAQQGLRVVALAKSDSAVHASDGLDLEAVARQLETEGSLDGLEGTDQIYPEELVGVDCDVLVPAARAGTLDATPPPAAPPTRSRSSGCSARRGHGDCCRGREPPASHPRCRANSASSSLECMAPMR
ncbi:MAG TPA: hypothetical protein VGW11_11210, partial [Solirubrobacteraceae bacterium]|nr:hypothetical protein [Solirubrobacteraceae bacterium]